MALSGARVLTPYVFTVPVVPVSGNKYQRMHWAAQQRVREAFQEQVWAAINTKGNRCPRGLESIEIHSVIQHTIRRRRDSDNYANTLNKWLQDVFVREGVIPDDTADRCTAHPPSLCVGNIEQTLVIVGER